MRWGLTTETILNSKFIIRSIICGIWGQIVGVDCKKGWFCFWFMK